MDPFVGTRGQQSIRRICQIDTFVGVDAMLILPSS